jgi:hypothetical protein
MQTLKQHITEAKNVHMEHLEDEIFNNGYAGGKAAVAFLESLVEMLSGTTSSTTKITVKWDGAPAIFVGINPENGKFFVASKSLFNKTPKINYTDADIDENHSGGLAAKLKVALKELPALGITGILQGDIMFTKGDTKKKKVGGETMLTFQPNTIVYAVPSDSDLASEIENAEIGVVFHTEYSGDTIAELKASYGPNISYLTKTSKVWFQDAEYNRTDGATFNSTETTDLKKKIKSASISLTKSKRALSSLSSSIVSDIKIYTNSNIRRGTTILDSKGFINWVDDKIQKSIDKLSQERAIKRKIAVKKKTIDYLSRNARNLDTIFLIHALLTEIKLLIVRKLETIKGIGTFIKTDDGFKVTAPEGFVAIDSPTGAVVKLVDRLEFSKQNFTAPKNWDK